MLTLPLEPTDDRAAPIFKDAVSCAAWLAQFQLTNLQRAHGQLLTQLNEFNRYPLQGLERFNCLELLRETVGYIQEDMAKKLIAKALPLSDGELITFVAITQLWQAMVTGYQRCLQAYVAGDKKLAEMGAILCERCLQYGGLGVFEHLRTGYECNPKFWYQLHDLYAFAEEQGFQEVSVDDALSPHSVASSCRNMYVKTLLACYAHPAELTRSQLKLLDRWLAVWSQEVRVEMRYSLSKGDAQPLMVDLSSTQGLKPLVNGTHKEQSRYLAMVPMSKLLRVKIILLQQGASLDQVGLGDLPNNAAAIELLNFIHQCWCEDSRMRLLQRQHVGDVAQVLYPFAAIFTELQGQTVFAKNSITHKKMDTFGKDLAADVVEADCWMIDDESVVGAKLTRQNYASGRLNLHQLVAVRRDVTTPFKLGAVIWLHVSELGLLQVGINYLPGVAEAIQLEVPGGVVQFGFLLPAVTTLRSPASLIVPREVYKAGGLLQIARLNNEKNTIKMGISVTRGFDYERVSFTSI